MAFTQKVPKIAVPKIVMPKVPHIPAEHIAKEFQAVHPRNTDAANLTDMYEVQKHSDYLKKDTMQGNL